MALYDNDFVRSPLISIVCMTFHFYFLHFFYPFESDSNSTCNNGYTENVQFLWLSNEWMFDMHELLIKIPYPMPKKKLLPKDERFFGGFPFFLSLVASFSKNETDFKLLKRAKNKKKKTLSKPKMTQIICCLRVCQSFVLSPFARLFLNLLFIHIGSTFFERNL